MFNIYADVDAISMTPSRNTRSYTLRSVPSSPGRSFFSYLYFCVDHIVGGWDPISGGVDCSDHCTMDNMILL